MDFSLSPEIEDYRQRVRSFVEREILPVEADRANYDEHENIGRGRPGAPARQGEGRGAVGAADAEGAGRAGLAAGRHGRAATRR